MILDASSGNRKIWASKNSENIIYLDIQKELEVKPSIFADNTKLPFQDKTFDSIFYDPPYAWNFKSMFYGYPNEKVLREKYSEIKRKGVPSYYGVERYKSKDAVLSHIFKALREFDRVLKDDGLLWMKWNEIRLTLDRILPLFDNWTELLRFELKDRSQTLSETQTFWLAFQKNNVKLKQQNLVATYILGSNPSNTTYIQGSA